MPCPVITEGYRSELLVTRHKVLYDVLPASRSMDRHGSEGGIPCYLSLSDSHFHRLAGGSSQHVFVPRDDVAILVRQVYLARFEESRKISGAIHEFIFSIL